VAGPAAVLGKNVVFVNVTPCRLVKINYRHSTRYIDIMNTGAFATPKRRHISVNPNSAVLFVTTALRTLDLTAKFVFMFWCSGFVAQIVRTVVEYAASVFRVPLQKMRQYIASKCL
jgi:hypothetical protein